ncbi:hypothetical protein ACEQ8H_005953 [Pleosporales sp. CAS-2024a]
MELPNFDADAFTSKWSDDKYCPTQSGKTFAQCIRKAFLIPKSDTYVYRAQAETTLELTQRAIDAKRSNGLHGWYHDEEGTPLEPQYPSPEEVEAYTCLFDPSLNLSKALTGFKSNAKANSIRQKVAQHLDSRFYSTVTGLLPVKKARTHVNPYLSMWAYSCQEVEYAGPIASTTHTKISHHILPIFYHHFGCVVPSYAALHVIARLAQPAKPSKEAVLPILDVGSGNGYWTYMLRTLAAGDMKPLDVRAIDNQLSEYRVRWIQDTIKMDGVKYLKNQVEHGKGCVLLLVYPQATGNFTGPILKAFQGDTIVVAGTQNGNGFTGFQDQVVDAWVSRELPAFELTLRMPLPSFAAKDEALFVFQRKKA